MGVTPGPPLWLTSVHSKSNISNYGMDYFCEQLNFHLAFAQARILICPLWFINLWIPQNYIPWTTFPSACTVLCLPALRQHVSMNMLVCWHENLAQIELNINPHTLMLAWLVPLFLLFCTNSLTIKDNMTTWAMSCYVIVLTPTKSWILSNLRLFHVGSYDQLLSATI